jgi:hypothetical protein
VRWLCLAVLVLGASCLLPDLEKQPPPDAGVAGGSGGNGGAGGAGAAGGQGGSGG